MTRISALRNRNSSIPIGVGLIILLILAALTFLTDRAQAAPKETFKIRYAYIPNANTGLLTIAQDKGIFKDLGLDMEMIRFNSGPAQFAAIKSGSIDVAEMSSMTFLVGRAQGIDAKIFSIIADISAQNILVAQRDSGIQSAKDLKGKKIAAVQGSSAYYGLMNYLSQNGMALQDIEFLNMDGAAITPAFMKKDVDAAWHWAPWCLKMIAAGGVAVTNNQDIGALGFQVILGRTEWVKGNPEAAKRILEFQGRVSKAMKNDPQLLPKLTAETLSIPVEMAVRVRDLSVYPGPEEMSSDQSIYGVAKGAEDGSAGLGALLKKTAEFQVSQGIVKTAPDLKTAIDAGPIKAWKTSR